MFLINKLHPSALIFSGDCSVVLKKPVTDSVEWARLEDGKSMKVKDFIDNLTNADGNLDLYLFDWSLPQHCLPLAEELTIPKYFAGKCDTV